MISHGCDVVSQCPKQKYFPLVLVAICYVSGVYAYSIFVMGAMLLASALSKSISLFVVSTL